MTIADYLSLNDDARYEEMRRATIAVIHQKCFDKYFKPTKKRWLDLSRVWDKALNCSEHYILTSAIHKIFWGVYPYTPTDPNTKYLLDLVEAELLDNGEAYQTWSRWVVFKRTFEMILESMESFGSTNPSIHFIEHYLYLRSRTLCRIKYDKIPSTLAGSVHTRNYQNYEDIIKKIIPESSNWSREEWGDDLIISDAVNRLYGIDYSDTFEGQRDYERLIQMLRAKKEWGEGSADFIWYASNISELPTGLARVIWPDNLEDKAASLLCDAHKMTVDYERCGQPFKDRKGDFHPLYHYERENLKNSWLFKVVSDWFYKGLYSGTAHDEVKAVIFGLQTTC